MFKYLIKNIKKRYEFVLFGTLVLFTIIFTSFYNQKQNVYKKNLSDLINNVYLKKHFLIFSKIWNQNILKLIISLKVVRI